MNYQELLEAFWLKQTEFRFNANEISLYHFLLHVNYELGWKGQFELKEDQITNRLKISASQFKSALNALSENGLVSYEIIDSENQVAKYWVGV